MRNFITIVEQGHLLTENINLAWFISLARQYPDVETFIQKTDGEDALYRGHSGGETYDNSFMTDYVGHASQYGEVVDAFAYDPQNVMYFDDNKFEDMRRTYRRASEWEPDQFEALYRSTLRGNRFASELEAQMAHVSDVILSDDDIAYSTFCANFEQNDGFIPLMQAYAANKGKNIIAFHGGDYGDYGGQNEYVVRDISQLTNLRRLHAMVQKELQ